jgi:hypothetical protein
MSPSRTRTPPAGVANDGVLLAAIIALACAFSGCDSLKPDATPSDASKADVPAEAAGEPDTKSPTEAGADGPQDASNDERSTKPDGPSDSSSDVDLEAEVGSERGESAPAICESAIGSWSITMPSWVITFQISESLATQGGPVLITWSSPGIGPMVGDGAFDAATCSLSQTYDSLCQAAAGPQCGDLGDGGTPVCPGGDVLTAAFDVPVASWWDAKGCWNGQSCTTCDQHPAVQMSRL